jgi:hypothetical protein
LTLLASGAAITSVMAIGCSSRPWRHDWTIRRLALALAMLNARELSGRISSMIRTDARDGSGFIVALEVMNAPGVVPQLRELIRAGHDHAWDLHHALWRLTGREPLVPLTADRDAATVPPRTPGGPSTSTYRRGRGWNDSRSMKPRALPGSTSSMAMV